MRLVTSSSITWSQWCSLSQQRLPAIVARAAGLYRVRSTSMDELLYIGQSNNLRRRILELRGAIQDSEMPWNDPHVAAARFWALLQNANHEFEISVARTTPDVIARKSLESLAISLYRAESGRSPEFNFGRMPDGWFPSSRRGKGIRGGFDPDITYSAHQDSIFSDQSDPTSADWLGLAWQPLDQLESSTAISGVYRALAPDRQSVVYIGESKDLRSRISTHSSNFESTWEYVVLDDSDHAQRLEIENDLIASHVAAVGAPPTRQFQN